MKKIALLGNPNCGKTTLFNALTKKRNKVANWAGVTVEVATAAYSKNLEIIDLPGCYSICHADTSGAIDEMIAANYLFNNEVDFIVNIIDSSNLVRSLYLTTQLLELELPTIIIVNKVDLLKNTTINIESMAKLLKPYAIISACTNDPKDIINIKHMLENKMLNTKKQKLKPILCFSDEIKNCIEKVQQSLALDEAEITASKQAIAINILSGNKIKNIKTESLYNTLDACRKKLKIESQEDMDIVIAQARYDFIKSIIPKIEIKQKTEKENDPVTKRLDDILTHKYLGIISLMCIMYLLFFFALSTASSVQQLFSNIGEVFLITGTATILNKLNSPDILNIFLIHGLGQGITTLLSFIPIVFTMFYSINFLEETGYMPRAAFVTDRLMRILHLPGKAFIPLLIGFSCNVPAIIATRTLETKRDRIIAGIMTPFMLCNARLAVFAIFASTFFPTCPSVIIFSLYITGVIVAIITGFILCRFIIPGDIQPLIMELPPYQIPKQKTIIANSLTKTVKFCFRVGKYIVGLSGIISILSSVSYEYHGATKTLLEIIGANITPMFNGIGVSNDNWQASVAIIAGIVAKETVIITLSQLYNGSLNNITTIPSDFWAYAIDNIQNSFMLLVPFYKASHNEINSSLQANLKMFFTNKNNVIAYLFFNLLYMPCISTIITFAKETNWRWAMFSATWSLSIAYLIASLILKITNMATENILVISVTVIAIALNIVIAKRIAQKEIKNESSHEFNSN